MIRRCHGLSLVELMVAMALGLVVSLGVVSVFTSASSTRQAQEQLALLQEEGRFAITQIRNDLAMAGAQYCAGTGGSAQQSATGVYLDGLRAPTVYARDPDLLMRALSDVTTSWDSAYPVTPREPYSLPSFLAMRGYDCTTSRCVPVDPSSKRNPDGFNIPAMGKGIDSRVIGASVLTVRYLKPASGWTITPEDSEQGSTLQKNADGSMTVRLHPLRGEPKVSEVRKDAPLVMLADCSSAQIFAVRGMGSSQLVSSSNNFVQPHAFQNMAAPRLFSLSRDLQTVTYYLKVVDNGDGMRHATGALVRRVNGGNKALGGTGEEIARGVERLDFKYGVQALDGRVRYYTAEQVDQSTRNDCPALPLSIAGGNDRGCLWRSVSLIEIGLLLSGQNPLYSLTPDELAYSYAWDEIATPASPMAKGRKVTPVQQGFPLPVLRREFTAVVAVRNANP
ncbi:PilW family protein [Dyella flagellata]|uniref:Type IV pilus assembly protein PilW n=1 Tax=Dyella flagellata TaxID=1867833 RepID=A0ABQ5XCL6_9GAMM|nr:PilW family protein [Dyella flagellata]GLQ89388.1 hypothetical protein GCM10007898_29610 [Dyella flagellata]